MSKYADAALQVLRDRARICYTTTIKAGRGYTEAYTTLAKGPSDVVAGMQATVGLIIAAEHLQQCAEETVKALRAALAEQMVEIGAGSLNTEHHTFYTQGKPQHVLISQPALVPPELMTKPEPQPDKKEIAKLLRAGELVPGCTLIGNNEPTLVIRNRNKEAA